jgi:hypothetical protein
MTTIEIIDLHHVHGGALVCARTGYDSDPWEIAGLPPNVQRFAYHTVGDCKAAIRDLVRQNRHR